MANWYGAARTNYVSVDLPAMTEALAPWDGVEIVTNPKGQVGFLAQTEDGSFPSWSEDEEGNEIEFSIEDTIMPHVAVGQVLVVITAGHEKMRYITGYANAYTRDADGAVRFKGIALHDIYELAAKQFGIDQATITAAEY